MFGNAGINPIYQPSSFDKPMLNTRFGAHVVAMDQETKNAAKLAHVVLSELGRYAPILRGVARQFSASGDRSFSGVYLGTLPTKRRQLDLALILDENPSPATLSDSPALAVSYRTNRLWQIEVFQPVSLYGLWVYYRAKPHQAYEETLDFVTALMLQARQLELSNPVMNAVNRHYELLRTQLEEVGE